MRPAVAAVLDAVLVAVLCACVLMGCALADTGIGPHSCCHKHGMRQCAYTLLERADRAHRQPAAAVPAAVYGIQPPAATAPAYFAPALPVPITHSADLFLRNRVLLI